MERPSFVVHMAPNHSVRATRNWAWLFQQSGLVVCTIGRMRMTTLLPRKYTINLPNLSPKLLEPLKWLTLAECYWLSMCWPSRAMDPHACEKKCSVCLTVFSKTDCQKYFSRWKTCGSVRLSDKLRPAHSTEQLSPRLRCWLIVKRALNRKRFSLHKNEFNKNLASCDVSQMWQQQTYLRKPEQSSSYSGESWDKS